MDENGGDGDPVDLVAEVDWITGGQAVDELQLGVARGAVHRERALVADGDGLLDLVVRVIRCQVNGEADLVAPVGDQ
jgi:hypothetical protein